MMELFHRPTVMRAGNSAPVLARSWALPTRPLWPVNPSPRPAASAAAFTLRPIRRGDSSEGRCGPVQQFLGGPDSLECRPSLLADVEGYPLGFGDRPTWVSHIGECHGECEYIAVPVNQRSLSQYKAGRIDLRELMLTEGREVWYSARATGNPGELNLERQEALLSESAELPMKGFHHDHKFSRNAGP